MVFGRISEEMMLIYINLRHPIQHLILLELYSTKEQENQILVVDIEYPVAQNPMEPMRPRRNAAVIGELLRKGQL